MMHKLFLNNFLTLNWASKSAWPSTTSSNSWIRSGDAFSPNIERLLKKSINILNSAPVTSCRHWRNKASNKASLAIIEKSRTQALRIHFYPFYKVSNMSFHFFLGFQQLSFQRENLFTQRFTQNAKNELSCCIG